MPAGAAVIFRDYDAPRRESLARRYLSICRGRGVFFLVAGDAALAARLGADGVHWPAFGKGVAAAPFATAGNRLIATASCHDGAALSAAAAQGASLALLSPVFPTQSHRGAASLGIARFKALAGASPIPVLALGGVDETVAPPLAGPNVAGIAAISAFLPRQRP